MCPEDRGQPNIVYSFVLANGTDPNGAVLFRIEATFPERDFDEVRDAFVAKYGEPNSRRTAQLENRAGATFASDELTWRDGTGYVLLRQRAGRIDRSAASMTHKGYADIAIDRAREANRGRAKDL